MFNLDPGTFLGAWGPRRVHPSVFFDIRHAFDLHVVHLTCLSWFAAQHRQQLLRPDLQAHLLTSLMRYV
jgi:hypothetical protein